MSHATPPLVYEKHYDTGGEMNTPPCDIYTAHRVYRASPRFLWVNAEPLWGEPYTQAHPDTLRTYRLERAVLDAGGVLTRVAQRQRTAWVLSLPTTAVAEGEGRWCDYVR